MVLGGCASNSSIKTTKLRQQHDKPAELTVSIQYIPQRTKNPETGLIEPYIAQLNPYTQQKGRVNASAVTSFISAKRAFQNGNYTQANELLKKVTQTDNELSGPWVLLGDIANKQKQFKKAIENYQKAIQVNRDNVNAYLRLAKLQRQLGKFIEAQNTYAKALSRWKDFPEAHLNLAVLYDIYLNKPLKAQRHLEAYQFLTSGRDKVRANWLAEIQQRTGEAIVLKVEVKKASTLASSR